MPPLPQFIRADIPALLAISGGRDSVALLNMLVLAGHRRIILAHLNHGLRGRESGQDAAFVRRLAKHYDLGCEIEKMDVAALAKEMRVSIEAAGRTARYAFLKRLAVRYGVSHLYLAHHADDQAETILANLCRGAALRGLAGMKQESHLAEGPLQLTLLRPLLDWRRADIDAYIAEHGLVFREDSSNTSLEHRRNRLRHEVLPLLKEVFDRDVSPIIARFGLQAWRDDQALWQMSIQLAEVFIQSDGSLTLNTELRTQPPALLSRMLYFWLADELKVPGIESDIIESALNMFRPGGPAKINLPGRRHLRRKAGRMWVVSPEENRDQ